MSVWLRSVFKCKTSYSLVQRHPREDKLAQVDTADGTQRNLLHLHTAKHDEVIFADQEGLVCEHQDLLLLVVPVINPVGTNTGRNNYMASRIATTAFTKTSSTAQNRGWEIPTATLCRSVPGVRDKWKIKKSGKETSYDHGAPDGSPLYKLIWGNQSLYHLGLQPICTSHLPSSPRNFHGAVLLQGYQECHCPNSGYTTKPSHGQLAYTDLQEPFAMWRGSRDLDAETTMI